MGQRLDSFSKSGGEEERVAAIDRFSQKMINSGHSVKVGRNILVRGIKGQKGRVARSLAKNIPLHRSGNSGRLYALLCKLRTCNALGRA